MVAEDDAFFGGDVVAVIVELDGGDVGVFVESKDFSGEPFAVGVVGDEVED